MNTYLILAKRWLEEVEGELYRDDFRFFTVHYEDVWFLFDKATGTHIAYASEEHYLYDDYENMIKMYDKIVKTPLYQKNLKKFNKYYEEGRIRPLEV